MAAVAAAVVVDADDMELVYTSAIVDEILVDVVVCDAASDAMAITWSEVDWIIERDGEN